MTKADLELSPYDPADYLESDVAMSYYLTEAFHSGDEAVIIDAIGVIARAKGMTDIAEKSGLSRPSLYRGLSKKGKPRDNADDLTTPIGLFNYAHSYFASAKKLSESEPKCTHPSAPINYLFAHSIELYLKSFLRQQNITVEKLKEFSHTKNSNQKIIRAWVKP